MVNKISAQQLKEQLETHRVELIDVREQSERAAGYIEGSTWIPLSQVTLERLPTGKPLVFHCHLGTRSAKACDQILMDNPTAEIYSLDGGIAAWEQAGYPVKTLETGGLPLAQQVMLILGFVLLIGALLSAFISPWFNLIAAGIGIGLITAAITGICSLSRILAKTPWNS